jgi:hypothetical protein
MKSHTLLAAGAGMLFFLRCAIAGPSIPFEVRWAFTYGPSIPTYMAITSRDRWLQFWKSMKKDQQELMQGASSGLDEVPEIDFKRYTLVVAGAGTKSTGGFTISIRNVFESNNSIRVSIIETKPGHNCAGTAMSTSPFVGASIPATSKQVFFDITIAETVC